ncbi:CapA family protein [Microbacterium sp. JB110]|uniref:CapA family protein n=1 Tax=Microbacterium sp. JB110 TaxID=2024477 RepID=UPI00097F61FD|nr:CapA family protein [Microbacterium sp. JB110]SJM49287.1 UDP-N-acetylmuramoylalanyl-D-glutamyl-2,6-diaminopimelate--D-alanyl-D-alanine ligase [Frigoribacterium sp. JB110]
MTFSLGKNGAKVTGVVDGASLGDVTIPDEIDGAPVTTIGKGAFARCTDLTAVIVPPTVKLVGAEAFAGCTSLTEVDLTGDIEVINARTFEGCSSLTRVHLPFGLKRLAGRAFAGCEALIETPHFVKTSGPNGQRINRNVREKNLPVSLEYIGEGAFAGCVALERIVIPHKITEVTATAFEGCKALRNVWLHSQVASVQERAFMGCDSLERVTLPAGLAHFGANAFSTGTDLVCSKGSLAYAAAEIAGLNVASAEPLDEPIRSRFGETKGITVADVLGDDALMQRVLDRYSIRPAAPEVTRQKEPALRPAPSRFVLQDGVYRAHDDGDGDVTISLVGDLMCGFRQQRSAFRTGEYDFSDSFASVAGFFTESDLALGNLESTFSESSPYARERLYVDDRPHLNAPSAFLEAVRNAGFDAVINAQNHMYDSGVRGVFETLDALNRAELIHNGMYAFPDEPRYTLFEIKGIVLAVVSFVDPARQRMKQAAFSDEGLAATVSHLERESAQRGIAAARAAGAEFVLAYAHWGREYTGVPTPRQERFARTVVDAGADFVFGSHSHCPQPYTVYRSVDNRSVPVVYSGGNFVSDMNRDKPITQDTFIARLTIGRGVQGEVVIRSSGYIPCRIIEDAEARGYCRTVPLEELLAGDHGYDPLVAEEDSRRIARVIGKQLPEISITSAHKSRIEQREADDQISRTVERYALREPAFMRQLPTTPERGRSRFTYRSERGTWVRDNDEAVGEAVILCGGSLLYDRAMERQAELGDDYEFRQLFRHARAALTSADLTLGSLGAIVAEMYPRLSVMNRELAGGHYSNARPEYLDALRFAGFDVLALANPYNLDAGVRGLAATETAVLQRGLVPSGIGVRKVPIFEINGIRIAVLSLTLNAYNVRANVTDEGARTLLNVFDPQDAQAQIKAAREAGAEFVLSYLDCRAAADAPDFAQRLAIGRELAEAGADYVVCVRPGVISKYRRHVTSDGREVPIATGLGTLMAGPESTPDAPSPLLKLVIRRSGSGAVEVVDSYVPMKRFPVYDGAVNALVPGMKAFDPRYSSKEHASAKRALSAKLGDDIAVDHKRVVTTSTHCRPQLTPVQVGEILGQSLSAQVSSTLGNTANKPLINIAPRKEDLRRGGAAVITPGVRGYAKFGETTVRQAKDAGVVLAISTRPQPGIPTIVVDDAMAAFETLMSAVRDKYSPVTVAVTGTAGKTTSKELLARVFERHYRTLVVEGNKNTMPTVGVVLQKLSDEDEAYVQEVHGGTPGAASQVSKVIKPDIALITNIGDGHLGQMGTIERVIEGKMAITDGMPESGVLVINNDSEYLRDQRPHVRTVRYSVSDPACEYHAQNIRSDGERLEFQIVSPDGVFDAKLNFQGVHNVSNALGVFAAARLAGIPPLKIVAGLSRYVPDSVRQNLVTYGGYRLLIDTYSSTPSSVVSAAETLCALPAKEGARRIAVLSDIPDQGDKAEVNHADVGRALGAMNFDLLLCCGTFSRHTAQAAREKGLEAYFFKDRDLFNRMIAESARPGDLVLFKGGVRVKLLENTVHALLGKIA